MILMGPSDPMVASDPFWVVASDPPTVMECHKGFGAQMRFLGRECHAYCTVDTTLLFRDNPVGFRQD